MRYLLVIAALLIGFAGLANAQIVVTLPCQPPALMAKALEKYGEATIGAGIDPQERPVMLQVNPSDESFSVLMRMAPGVVCLVVSGKGWEAIDPEKPGSDL